MDVRRERQKGVAESWTEECVEAVGCPSANDGGVHHQAALGAPLRIFCQGLLPYPLAFPSQP